MTTHKSKISSTTSGRPATPTNSYPHLFQIPAVKGVYNSNVSKFGFMSKEIVLVRLFHHASIASRLRTGAESALRADFYELHGSRCVPRHPGFSGAKRNGQPAQPASSLRVCSLQENRAVVFSRKGLFGYRLQNVPILVATKFAESRRYGSGAPRV